MKKIYLDSINIDILSINSLITILYNLIIINRSQKAKNYKLSFDQNLSKQYLKITDFEIQKKLEKQIEHKIEKILNLKNNQFFLVFRVFVTEKIKKSQIFPILKKKCINVFEEYILPINIIDDIDKNILCDNIDKKIEKILLHLQEDQTNMSITQILEFDIEIRK